MALFLTPEDHAANPPETWKVVKMADRFWALQVSSGGTLNTFPTKAKAEADRVDGPLVKLYNDEGRWMAGEQVNGWRPYAELAGSMRTAAERRSA